ncbi:MAG: transglycosylase SLT domain-containing protein [Flavobacteriales bacterium]|jgi:membrane-bound lytic murein transglycosylase F
MRKFSAEALGTGLFALLLLALALLPSVGGIHFAKAEHGANDLIRRDLREIHKDTLRVLVLPDALTYEPRPGARTGLEWELLERFARWEKVAIKPIPVSDRDSMYWMLRHGLGDIIAAQTTQAGWASPGNACTQGYRLVACMRATVPGGKTQAKDSLAVSAWSPFLDTLGRLVTGDSAWRVAIKPQPPEVLLTSVALGRTKQLLVTDATAYMEAKRLPLVEFKDRTGRSVPLVFVVRPNSEKLLHALDTWLALSPEREVRRAMIEAYENGLDTRKVRASRSGLTLGSDSISPFDSLFQLHADSSSLDWKLLAAVAYKESSFDTSAVSYAGAGGLMQMMPATAAAMGVTKEGGVDGHIRGASQYLHTLNAIWQREVSRDDQRMKFVLAAYNAGPGHVKDAQRLAKTLGLDPNRWDGNVEKAMVLLNRPRYFTLPLAKNGYCRGQDVYFYVREVTGLFGWLRGNDMEKK